MKRYHRALVWGLVWFLSPICFGQQGSAPRGHFGWCYQLAGPCWLTYGHEPHNCGTYPNPDPVAQPGSTLCQDPNNAEVLVERLVDSICRQLGSQLQICYDEQEVEPCITLQLWSCQEWIRYYIDQQGHIISIWSTCYAFEQQAEGSFGVHYETGNSDVCWGGR
jgi:hypothetical protein